MRGEHARAPPDREAEPGERRSRLCECTHRARPAIAVRGPSQKFPAPRNRASPNLLNLSLAHPPPILFSPKDAATARPAPAPRSTPYPRLAIPSKGRMAEDTLALLADCQLKVYKPNPRQYVATIPALPGLEVWFQRASDVVRKLMYGDVDLGIVGYDMLAEVAGGDGGDDLVVLHDALGFGGCHLGLGIPVGGRFAGVDSLDALRAMPDWTAATPLRVVTGYQNVARTFFEKAGFPHVRLLGADGALEAAPLMGTADIILDLVSTGVTLRENGLKQVAGGTVLESQGVLVANRAALVASPALLDVVHELIERFEAHLKADAYFSVIANVRGCSAGDVADRILARPELGGLEGPTISPVFTRAWATSGPGGGPGPADAPDLFAATVCVPKRRLYESVKALRAAGGSGVLVQPMTYIFDEEPARWRALLADLGLDGYVPGNGGGAGVGAGGAKEAAAAA